MKKFTFFEVIDYITAFLLLPLAVGGVTSLFVWAVVPHLVSVAIRPLGIVVVGLVTLVFTGIKMPKLLSVVYGKDAAACLGALAVALFLVAFLVLCHNGMGWIATLPLMYGFCFASLGWRLQNKEAFCDHQHVE